LSAFAYLASHLIRVEIIINISLGLFLINEEKGWKREDVKNYVLWDPLNIGWHVASYPAY
jgi:hypothetical protein